MAARIDSFLCCGMVLESIVSTHDSGMTLLLGPPLNDRRGDDGRSQAGMLHSSELLPYQREFVNEFGAVLDCGDAKLRSTGVTAPALAGHLHAATAPRAPGYLPLGRLGDYRI